MRVIDPSFSLTTPFGPLTPELGVQMLRFIEAQARLSHRSEASQTEDSWKRFIEAVVLQHGDWSVAEHASVTAVIRTDRGVTHELVRHRLFSITQESTRFVNYGKRELEFIYPTGLKRWDCSVDAAQVYDWHWQQAMIAAENEYNALLQKGYRPQEARSVLPNALASTIAVTGNLRNWRHWLLMRTSKETHPDFRRISDAMLIEFKKSVPLLFDDIEAGVRQVDNLRKAR